MFETGRICIKIAGRDAGKKCVIVQQLGKGTVVIDGQTRRRKCNIKHLEPTNTAIELKEKATAADVAKAFQELNIEVRSTKPKKPAARPKKQKAKKEVAPEEKPAKQKAAKPKQAKADVDTVAKELAGEEAPIIPPAKKPAAKKA